jgi:predicted AAA+ superfamily ATPase
MIERKLYVRKIKPFIGKKLIKVLTGQRRVGKSMMLKWLIKLISEEQADANIIFIDKEDYQYDHIKDYHDLMTYVNNHRKSGMNYLFIDEIQEITAFQKALRSLYNLDNFDIYCTGSNAKLFSSELSTVLSGRQIVIQIGGLNFNEFCLFHKLTESGESLLEYMKYGGLPYLMHLPNEDEIRFEYLKNIYATILFRDIVQRQQIRDASFLTDLLKFLADNTGNIFSANRISAYLKAQRINKNVNLILNYIKYIEEAFFINPVKRIDLNGKKIFEVGEKYYFEDIGLRNSIVGFHIRDIGKIMENLVFLHLRNHGYDIKTGQSKNKEIDFVATRNNERTYIQVCYLLSEPATIEREFGNLVSIRDNYPKYVISFDSFSTPNTYKGIKHLTLLEFLQKFE